MKTNEEFNNLMQNSLFHIDYSFYINNKILFFCTKKSVRQDSNLRPLRPERSALPN